MKKIIIILSFLIPAFAQAGGAIVSGGLEGLNDRAILISFTSLGAGIDEGARDQLLDFVKAGLANTTITVVKSKPEGFEGDVSYCIEFQNSTVMSQYFDAVNMIVMNGKNISGFTNPDCQ